MKLLIIGDIVGSEGKFFVEHNLKRLRKENEIDFVIANCENTSTTGFKSLIKKDYDLLINSGIDYITMGNHTFDNEKIRTYINDVINLVRPANLNDENDGVGFLIFPHSGKKILLLNLLGEVYMKQKVKNPFHEADRILSNNDYDIAILDFHAESTAEKIVLANYLSKKHKKLKIFFGTHTHIQTNDLRILNNNTVYITDLGMCGVYNSAIGASFTQIEDRLRGKKSEKFVEAKGKSSISGIIVDISTESLKVNSFDLVKILE